MYSLGKRSLERLSSCHPQLQEVITEAAKHMDITVLCGHRGEAEQDEAFKAGNSKTPWPTSKHNQMPSLAVDVAPYPVTWEDTRSFHYMAGIILGIASQKGIELRWGGDWNGDSKLSNDKFNDSPHFELKLKI